MAASSRPASGRGNGAADYARNAAVFVSRSRGVVSLRARYRRRCRASLPSNSLFPSHTTHPLGTTLAGLWAAPEAAWAVLVSANRAAGFVVLDQPGVMTSCTSATNSKTPSVDPYAHWFLLFL